MHGAVQTSPLDRALELADTYGWFVFPVKVSSPGPDGKSKKTSLIKWGSEASNDPDLIEGMLTSEKRVPAWQHATHVGVACQPSGVWVVDEDKPGAADSLKLPETLIMSTRRGRHYIYSAAAFDQRNTEGDPVEGVDIRGNGGMFVIYGNVAHDADIAPWPFDEIIGKAKGTGKVKPATAFQYSERVANLTIPGKRHNAVRSIAMTAANYRFPQTLIEGLLSGVCDTYDDQARETVASAYAKVHPEVGDDATEDGVALQFTKNHAHDLRYDADAGRWFEWNGEVWKRDDTQRAYSYARRIARETAFTAELDQKASAAVRKASFASGVERFARSDPRHAVTQEIWDKDPYLLGVPNGEVDLRTGRLLPANPENFITKTAAVAPSSTADCPNWLRFLSEATAGDQGVIDFLRRWCGYCLTGDTREHALIFLYGPGGNGKSVFLNTVTRILGGYATTAAMDTFTSSRGDKHPTELALLRGARMVSASETEEGRAWAEARIKQMTGGDPITARFMRQDFFTYQPQFKLTIVGNHAPALANVDDAARRRFNIVPFTIKPKNPDRELEEKLEAEWPAILRWMVDGCIEWRKQGLQQPESVKAATNEYFGQQDLTAQWLEDCARVEIGNDYLFETSAELFNSWSAFAKSNGEDPGNTKGLASRLRRLGLRQSSRKLQGKTYRGWMGAQLLPRDNGGQRHD